MTIFDRYYTVRSGSCGNRHRMMSSAYDLFVIQREVKNSHARKRKASKHRQLRAKVMKTKKLDLLYSKLDKLFS